MFEFELELQIQMYHCPVFWHHSEWIKMMNFILLQGLVNNWWDRLDDGAWWPAQKANRPDDFYDVQGRFWLVLPAKNIRPIFGLLFSAITRAQAIIQSPISLNAIQDFSIVLLITEFVYDWGRKIIIVIIQPRPDWCNLKVVALLFNSLEIWLSDRLR